MSNWETVETISNKTGKLRSTNSVVHHPSVSTTHLCLVIPKNIGQIPTKLLNTSENPNSEDGEQNS